MSACNENTVRCESRPGGACCLDHLFNLLVELDDVCVSLDLPYVLAFGSLLGSVRERDIIPHDTDADVIMMQGDFDKLMENKHLIKRPIKRDGKLDIYRVFLSDLNKLHVDIWVGRKDGTNLKIKTCTGHYIFPMRFVEEKKTGILRNKEFPIPKDYDTLLERVYGEDWKTPIKNKHPICELDKEYE